MLCKRKSAAARLLLTSARLGTRVSQGNQTHCDTIWCLKIQKKGFLAKSNVIQMLLYSNLASLHFSNKYWITLNFAEIHIFRIYRPHTLLICIWFPWDTRVPTLAEVKRRRGASTYHLITFEHCTVRCSDYTCLCISYLKSDIRRVHHALQSWEKVFANLAKQDPGRARQKS